MKRLIARLIREEEGQDLIEYALLGALIAVVMVAALTGLQTALDSQYQVIEDSLPAGS